MSAFLPGVAGPTPLAVTGGALLVSGLTTPVVYLLRDEFTTPAAAPLVSPRTAEPGPGTETIVDTNSVMSISGSTLVVNGTLANNDRIITPSSYARTSGRALLFSVPTRTTTSTQWRFGWGDNVGSGVTCGLDYSSATTVRVKDGVNVILSATLGSASHALAFIQRSAGGFVLARNGTSGAHTLLWVYDSATSSDYAKLWMGSAAALNLTIGSFRITDLTGSFASDYGIATARTAVTSAGSSQAMTADAIVEHTITAATGVTQELRVRETDANNRWIVRMDQAGGTIKLIQLQAGVETERSSALQTWTNGIAYRIVAICDGTTISTYVAGTAKNTYASATFNQSATTTSVSTAGTNLVSWPRTVTLPSV